MIVVTGGTLRLRSAASVADTAVVRVSGTGKLREDAVAETMGTLYLGGVRQRRGTYGASASSAQYTTDTYFSTCGTGVVNVARGPEGVFSVR